MLASNFIAAKAAPRVQTDFRSEDKLTECREGLACISMVKTYDAKAPIIWERDPDAHIYEILSGVVMLYKLTPDGRRQITEFKYPGRFLGLGSDGQYVHNAEALTNVTLCKYPRKAFVKLAEQSPAFMRHLLQLATDDLTAAQNQMLLLGRKNVLERISTFLLTLADNPAAYDSERGCLHLPMTRTDIGDHLGLTTETVSRGMRQLHAMGVIEIRHARDVYLLDVDMLEDVSSGCHDETLNDPCEYI